MIRISKLEMKNFLSVGNITQEIFFDKNRICLIIGENLDVNFGSGSRNGVGKTTIIHALCYALYGTPLTHIKKDNLINKINGKNMYVAVEFYKGNNFYRIERGRKPNFLNFFVNNQLVKNPDQNEAEGESRWTQSEIENIIGISSYLFKYLIVMNTYTEPFLSLPLSNQRQFIEDLLGIKQLSLKAEALKQKIKETEQEVQKEEIRIKTIEENNIKIEKTIEEIRRKSIIWESEKNRKIKQIDEMIEKMLNININEEILKHEYKKQLKTLEENFKNINYNLNTMKNLYETSRKKVENLAEEVIALENEICPVCKRPFHFEENENNLILEEKRKNLEYLYEEFLKTEKDYEELEKQKEECENNIKELKKKDLKTFYERVEEVYEHKTKLITLQKTKEELLSQKNPFEEQIISLKENSIQKVDYTKLNNMVYLLEKQKMLLKLLVNKESFIRKKIIDQNLQYLNNQLKKYCNTLNIPHELKFLNDFSMEIKMYDLEYDFENLSRGEKTRVILALNLSFRDLYEIMKYPINILIIDELIDNGLDNFGIESVLEVLKNISVSRNKNIFIISHRDEIINKFDDIIYVVKENNFTSINCLN
ncbi:MAG: AAA family ATPase [Candidatus Aenigmatarchaeota archaeon]